MRRASLLLVVVLLTAAPGLAGAFPVPILHFSGNGLYDSVNNYFDGSVNQVTAVDTPMNAGTYLAPSPDPILGPVTITADIGFGLLSANNFFPATDTAPYTGPSGVFNLPYYFLQTGIGTFTVDAAGTITGTGSDFKADPSLTVGAISPFESFFGIVAPNDQYVFTFRASLDQAGIYHFDLTNTPVPEPGTLLLLGSGLAGLVGAYRRKIFKA